MCMLYGFSAKDRYNLGPTLREFFMKSVYHPDGWGVGYYDQGKAIINKEPYRAIYRARIKEFYGMESNLCVAHIRKATRGGNKTENTHPFMKTVNGKQWIFAHNGTVRDEAFNEFQLRAKGSTDSEKCFLYIMENLEKGGNEIEVIEKAVCHLASYGKFNMIMTDGERMFIHTNMKNTLYQYKKDDLMCLVTKSLETVKKKQIWSEVPINRMIVCENGEICHVGKVHGFEYKMLTK